MDARRRTLDTLFHLVHEHFLWLLLGSYTLSGKFTPFG